MLWWSCPDKISHIADTTQNNIQEHEEVEATLLENLKAHKHSFLVHLGLYTPSNPDSAAKVIH